jgi:GNAT superfamily N-acetyltransferase
MPETITTQPEPNRSESSSVQLPRSPLDQAVQQTASEKGFRDEAIEFLTTKGAMDTLMRQFETKDKYGQSRIRGEIDARIAAELAAAEPDKALEIASGLKGHEFVTAITPLVAAEPEKASELIKLRAVNIDPVIAEIVARATDTSFALSYIQAMTDYSAKYEPHHSSLQAAFRRACVNMLLALAESRPGQIADIISTAQRFFAATKERLSDISGTSCYREDLRWPIVQSFVERARDKPELTSFVVESVGDLLDAEQVAELSIGLAGLDADRAKTLLESMESFDMPAEKYFEVLQIIEGSSAKVPIEYTSELLQKLPATEHSIRMLMKLGTPEATELAFAKMLGTVENRFGYGKYRPDLLAELTADSPELATKVLDLYEFSGEKVDQYSVWRGAVMAAAKLQPERALEAMGDEIDKPLMIGVAQVMPEKIEPKVAELREYDQRDYAGALAIGFASTDIEKAIEWANKGNDEWVRGGVAIEIAKTDPERAIDFLSDSHQSFIPLIEIGQTTPAAVEKAIRIYSDSHRRVDASHAELLAETACHQPEFAARLLKIINEISTKESGYSSDSPQRRRQVNIAREKVFNFHAQNHPLTFLGMLSQDIDFHIYDSEMVNTALTAALDGAFAEDPAKAATLLSKVKGEYRAQLLAGALKYDESFYDRAKLAAQKELAGRFDDTKSAISVLANLVQNNRPSEAEQILQEIANGVEQSYDAIYKLSPIGHAIPELASVVVSRLIELTTSSTSSAYDQHGIIMALAKFVDTSQAAKEAIADVVSFRRYGKSTKEYNTELVGELLAVDPVFAGEMYEKILDRASDNDITKQLSKLSLEDFSKFVLSNNSGGVNLAFIKNRLNGQPESATELLNLGEQVFATSPQNKIELYSLFIDYLPDVAFKLVQTYEELDDDRAKKSLMGEAILAYARLQNERLDPIVREKIYGATNPVLDPFNMEKDRSFNFRAVTAEDIEASPQLIATLVAQTANAAELRALLVHLDGLYDTTAAKIAVFRRATNAIYKFKQVGGMEETYKAQIALQAQGVRDADHEMYAALPKLRQLYSNLDRNGGELEYTLEYGYGIADLIEQPWLLNGGFMREDTERFPTEGSKGQKATWLADHAFVRLQGFNRNSIGQIIYNRLCNNLEPSLHDTTQWLQAFAIEENAHRNPVKKSIIKKDGSVEESIVYDASSEYRLLSILVDPSQLTAQAIKTLPGFDYHGDPSQENISKIKTLFHDPTNAVIYMALLRCLRQQDIDRPRAINVDEVSGELRAAEQLIDHWLGQDKEIQDIDLSTIDERARLLFQPRHDLGINSLESGMSNAQQLNNEIRNLKAVGKSRKEYIDSTTSWLRKYQNLGNQTLTRAWFDRAIAVQNGCEDEPKKIIEWALANAFRLYVERQTINGELPGGKNASELLAKYEQFIPALTTRYGAKATLRAIDRLDNEQVFETDFPSAVIDLGDGYSFRVFAKNDPAGFTIGHDTDCCMTLEGASESCIWAGYTDRRAGFVGLYENNKLLAQSFVWHNSGEDGDTMVLDNIEAQRGRSISNVSDLYKKALSIYLTKLAGVGQTTMRSVNLGTGYLEGDLGSGLVSASPVRLPIGMSHIYSDARSQLVLLRLDDNEMAALKESDQLRRMVLSEITHVQERPQTYIEFVKCGSDDEMVDMIARLEAQIYPAELQTGIEDVRGELAKPNNYSFVIYTRSGDAEAAGYMLAYHDKKSKGIYVSDLAIRAEHQRDGYGFKALIYLLDLADSNMENRITFETRESTSYQALNSNTVLQLLTRRGFEIVKSQALPEYFENGENAYSVVLERK